MLAVRLTAFGLEPAKKIAPLDRGLMSEVDPKLPFKVPLAARKVMPPGSYAASCQI